MGKEDAIGELLRAGWMPRQIIDQHGYAKATVYKVYHSMRVTPVAVSTAPLAAGWRQDKERYLPGETARVTIEVTNQTRQDLYAMRVGLRPEWLVSPSGQEVRWYAAESRTLVHPGASVLSTIDLPIPADLPLGERDLLYGVESQFVGQPGPGPLSTTWFDPPMVLKVQRPRSGMKVFLSHAVADLRHVNRLASSLEDYGIEAILGEDELSPGVRLEEKFSTLIRQAHVVVALLTPASCASEWVRFEINFARHIRKPLILLRDASLGDFQTGWEDLEYCTVDLRQGLAEARDRLLANTEAALRQVNNARRTELAKVGLFSGLLGLLLGIAAMGTIAAARRGRATSPTGDGGTAKSGRIAPHDAGPGTPENPLQEEVS